MEGYEGKLWEFKGSPADEMMGLRLLFFLFI